MWGEIGFPGDEAVEMEVPAAIGGIPESCLLDELDERCICTDEDIESDSAAFESRIRWNRVKAADVAVVLRTGALLVESAGFIKSFRISSIFRNSEMFSSSA